MGAWECFAFLQILSYRWTKCLKGTDLWECFCNNDPDPEKNVHFKLDKELVATMMNIPIDCSQIKKRRSTSFVHVANWQFVLHCQDCWPSKVFATLLKDALRGTDIGIIQLPMRWGLDLTLQCLLASELNSIDIQTHANSNRCFHLSFIL